jgi:hypothetical protein
MLLKREGKNSFFNKNRLNLSDWIFFLEIELNDGKYLTIKRSVNSSTKISFKEHFSRNQDFSQETKWDDQDLSVNSSGEDQNPKKILERKYLKFNVANDYGYRSFLSFLLREELFIFLVNFESQNKNIFHIFELSELKYLLLLI